MLKQFWIFKNTSFMFNDSPLKLGHILIIINYLYVQAINANFISLPLISLHYYETLQIQIKYNRTINLTLKIIVFFN